MSRPAPNPARGPRQLLTPTPAPTPEPEETHRLVTNVESRPVAAAAARAPVDSPKTAGQWRRAIIASTLLTPPPGLGNEDPWAPVG
jgi:hypothetical protein